MFRRYHGPLSLHDDRASPGNRRGSASISLAKSPQANFKCKYRGGASAALMEIHDLYAARQALAAVAGRLSVGPGTARIGGDWSLAPVGKERD